MSIDLLATYTLTAPAGVDGYGEVAVLNDRTSGNYVGDLLDLSFGREVRESAENKPESHGGLHGSFYSGRLPFTMEVQMAKGTWTAANTKADKLAAAFNAMASDGTIVWTETGRVATRLLFRQQQSPRGPDTSGKVILSGVSADAYILANVAATPTAPAAGLTNAGKAATFPSFTFTSGASGTVVLSRTSPSPTEALTLTIGGSDGLAASTATTVDFAARTVFQGSTDKRSAVTFPSSVWWKMAPGANTITSSGASSVLVTWRSAWLP